jgi:type I site-specific restriction endonuclease
MCDQTWWNEVKRLMVENFYRSPEDADKIIEKRKLTAIVDFNDSALYEAESLSWNINDKPSIRR